MSESAAIAEKGAQQTQIVEHRACDIDAMLHDYLQGRDTPCPFCGYNLRNTSSLRCPECGSKITLTLGTIRVKQGAWLWCVIITAMPLGFVLVTLATQLYAGQSVFLSEYERPMMKMLGYGLAGSIAALLLVAIGRGFLLRRARWARLLISLIWSGFIAVQTGYYVKYLSEAVHLINW